RLAHGVPQGLLRELPRRLPGRRRRVVVVTAVALVPVTVAGVLWGTGAFDERAAPRRLALVDLPPPATSQPALTPVANPTAAPPTQAGLALVLRPLLAARQLGRTGTG